MSELIVALRSALAAQADPERAVRQQWYMKSTMPFLGLTMPEVRRTVRVVTGRHLLPDAACWRETVRTLWDEATHREHRYAAIGVLRHRAYRTWATDPAPPYVGLLRELIVSGAWWDLVDELASHCVGDLLAAHPPVMTPILRGWATEDDLWLRRTAIICQLGRKADTDLDLLTAAIDGSIGDRDFFARKAIGWALREYSKTDEAWVRRFVATHPQLSPLSEREALKWLTAQQE